MDANKLTWALPLIILCVSFIIIYRSHIISIKTSNSSWLSEQISRIDPKVIVDLTLRKYQTRTIIQKAKVFHNRKGLKNQIEIEDPLRELNAIAKTTSVTIEELIEKTSIWIPQLYWESFSVAPMCIIILEKKINEMEKAEIRFGVAMSCYSRIYQPRRAEI